MPKNKQNESEYYKMITNETMCIFKQTLVMVISIALISFLVNVCVQFDVVYLNAGLSEWSLTEIMQVVLLLSTAMIFLKLAKKNKSVKSAAILVAGFFLTLAIREMDHWLDNLVHGFWLYPALAVTLFVIVKAWAGGLDTFNQLAQLINTPAFKQLIIFLMLLLVFSRIYGMSSFWHHVMSVHYVGLVKTVSEEAIELLCYAMIFFSACQLSIHKGNK